MKSLNIMQFCNSKNNNTKSKTTKIKSTSYYPSKKYSYNNNSRYKWNMVSLYRDPNLPRGGCGSCRGAM